MTKIDVPSRRGSEVSEINTRLFIVEGPACSGKSETARFLADTMKKNKLPAALFDENAMNHPADYTFHAYMTEDMISQLTQEERRQLYGESVRIHDGYTIPLTKVSVNLFGKVIPYKIYDRLDWETERPVMLAHWDEFADKTTANNKIYVFNSCLLQNPVGEMLIRFNFPFSEIKAYIDDICRLITPLDPAVIYLKCTDIRARIEEISEKRTAVWLNTAVMYHTSQEYGKHSGLSGFDGYIRALEDRQDTDLQLLSMLPVKKLILTDPFKDWDSAYESIDAFLAGKALQNT
jgi:hypothetical protein